MNRTPLFEICAEAAGVYGFAKYKNDADGNPIESTREVIGRAEVPNLLTNSGMNSFGSFRYESGNVCCVGSGSATPQVTDTALQSQVAQTAHRPASIGGGNGIVLTDPLNRYGWVRRVWRFLDGEAAGNLQEVGIRTYNDQTGATVDTPLLSRALILDVNGNPTSITILDDETLDVFWELRVYIPNDDTAGSVVLDGVTYNYTVRPIDVGADTYGAWRHQLATGIALAFPTQEFAWQNNPYHPRFTASAADQHFPQESGGAASMGPNYLAITQETRQPYVANSFYRDTRLNMRLQDANVVGGVRSLFFSTGMFGAYHILFDKPVPKNNEKKWEQTMRVSWARRA